MPPASTQLVVVTGLSGAGKSTALRALADVGYYCVDNLPPSLAAATVTVCATGGLGRVALGMDIRVGAFLDAVLAAIEGLGLEHPEAALSVLFLDASDEVLVRRFSETRRPHPMLHVAGARRGGDGQHALAVLDGVWLERERLGPIRKLATLAIDTSLMTVHELRRRVIDALGPAGDRRRMETRIMSFGFKYGVPLDADLLFDVRFLDNPHFVAELRELSGSDQAVADFVLRSPGTAELLDHLSALLRFSLPRYEREGRSYLTLAVGCTGGRHRSVAISIALADRLSTETGRAIGIVHRDLDRDGSFAVPAARASQPGRGSRC